MNHRKKIRTEKQADMHPQIHVITGGVHSGKTTFLSGLVRQLQMKQVSVAGFFCEGSFKENKRFSFTLVNVENGKSHDLATVEENAGWTSQGRFYFNPETVAEGERILRKGIEKRVDLLVLDEVGPFELKGQIWSGALEMLVRAHATRQIWVVREQILEEVLKRWNIPHKQVLRLGPGMMEEITKKILDYVRNDEVGTAT